MLINKKTRAFATCLLIVQLILLCCGCDVGASDELPSDFSGQSEGLYIGGSSAVLEVPDEGMYYYSQLNDVQKAIYSASLTALESESHVFELVGIDCTEYAGECKRAIEALLRDHPEFFWLDGGYQVKSMTMGSDSYGSIEITLKLHSYWENRDFISAKEKVESVVDSIVDQADDFDNDFDKVLFVNDWIVGNLDYDFESYTYPDKMDEEDYAFVNTIYGALVERRTLCGGYAYTFSYILNRLGVETVYVTGTALGELHAWNVVRIGDEFYHFDVTWSDDNGSGSSRYSYFALDDEEMSLTHKVDTVFEYPYARGTEYNYFRYKGLYLDYYSFNKFNSLFAAHSFDVEFSVKFSNEVVLRAAVKDIIENAKFYKLSNIDNTNSFSYKVDEIHGILTLYP